jgi:hypothetical protein
MKLVLRIIISMMAFIAMSINLVLLTVISSQKDVLFLAGQDMQMFTSLGAAFRLVLTTGRYRRPQFILVVV